MTETKWTPGPWEVLPLDSKYYGTKIKIGDDIIIVWTPDHFLDPFASKREIEKGWSATDDGHDHVEDGQSYANANLISAAPDLYTSVERLLLEFDVMIERGVIPDVRNDIIFDNARAAMRKARGE